jgi:hypothetical protein
VEVLEAIADRLPSYFPIPTPRGKSKKNSNFEEVLAKLRGEPKSITTKRKMTIVGQLAELPRKLTTRLTLFTAALIHVNDYIKDLLEIIRLYTKHYPEPVPELPNK